MAIGMSNIFKMEKGGPVKKKESNKENEQAKVLIISIVTEFNYRYMVFKDISFKCKKKFTMC